MADANNNSDEVHTIIAVQFTEVRAVVEVYDPGNVVWISIARTVSLLNNVHISTRHWEFMVFQMEFSDPLENLDLLPLGFRQLRITMVLHGRLGDQTVNAPTRIVAVTALERILRTVPSPALYFEDVEGDNGEGVPMPPLNIHEDGEVGGEDAHRDAANGSDGGDGDGDVVGNSANGSVNADSVPEGQMGPFIDGGSAVVSNNGENNEDNENFVVLRNFPIIFGEDEDSEDEFLARVGEFPEDGENLDYED
ncbi:hypothetical protein SCUCBS95973_007723 [Sporothrix curviconia]|uniref:Uncharacterized protein n=1 Tax=Sporothrix curviconia TaxID=1260050 RepID=A0ABP0CG04_9PEZI